MCLAAFSLFISTDFQLLLDMSEKNGAEAVRWSYCYPVLRICVLPAYLALDQGEFGMSKGMS